MSTEEPTSGFGAITFDGALVPFPIAVPPTADRSGAKAADGPLWWPLVSGTELSRCAGGRAPRGANNIR